MLTKPLRPGGLRLPRCTHLDSLVTLIKRGSWGCGVCREATPARGDAGWHRCAGRSMRRASMRPAVAGSAHALPHAGSDTLPRPGGSPPLSRAGQRVRAHQNRAPKHCDRGRRREADLRGVEVLTQFRNPFNFKSRDVSLLPVLRLAWGLEFGV